MEDTTISKKEVKNSTTDVNNNTPLYCYLEEAMRVLLRCLGFENHEQYSTKSGEEKKEVVGVDSSSSSVSSEKDGEVNEASDVQGSKAGGVGGATDPEASSSTADPADAAADLASRADPSLGSPAISVEDIATAARRPSRPPINSGSGPQTN